MRIMVVCVARFQEKKNKKVSQLCSLSGYYMRLLYTFLKTIFYIISVTDRTESPSPGEYIVRKK